MRLPVRLLRSCTLVAALIVWAPAVSDAEIVDYLLSGSITSVPAEISSISIGDPFEARLVVDLDTPCNTLPSDPHGWNLCNQAMGNDFWDAVVSHTISIGSWTSSGQPGNIDILDDYCNIFVLIWCPSDFIFIDVDLEGAPLLDGHAPNHSSFSLRSKNLSVITDITSVPDLVTAYNTFFADPGDDFGQGMTLKFQDPASSEERSVGGVVESVIVAPTECNDLVDNDGDTLVDHPDDPGCWGGFDLTESLDCSDGIDNDGDLLVDLADPGCADGSDPRETSAALVCDNGLDDDSDGRVDSADPGCVDPTDPSELSATIACDDGVDNDGDGLTDMVDPGCTDLEDLTETWVILICDDGKDNDGDGLVDLADPVCIGPIYNRESAPCQNGTDNDGDGLIDFDGGVSAGLPPAEQTAPDPGCTAAYDTDEQDPAPRCGLGVELTLLLPLLAFWRRARSRPAGPSR